MRSSGVSHTLEDEKPRLSLYIGAMKLGTGWRGVLALLCLLASFAYSTRAVMPTMPMDREPGLSASMQHDMAHMAMGDETSSAHSEHPSRPESTHSHEAHCPFCFTTGFALEGQSFLLPAVLEGVRLETEIVRVHARVAQTSTHQARGPPTLPNL